MDIVADLFNSALHCNQPSRSHKIDNRVEEVVISNSRSIQPSLARFSRNPYLKHCNGTPTAYIDDFIDDFLGLSQGSTYMRHHV